MWLCLNWNTVAFSVAPPPWEQVDSISLRQRTGTSEGIFHSLVCPGWTHNHLCQNQSLLHLHSVQNVLSKLSFNLSYPLTISFIHIPGLFLFSSSLCPSLKAYISFHTSLLAVSLTHPVCIALCLHRPFFSPFQSKPELFCHISLQICEQQTKTENMLY